MIKESGGVVWWDPYRSVALIRWQEETAALHPQAHLALIRGEEVLTLSDFSLVSGVPYISRENWNELLTAMKKGKVPLKTQESISEFHQKVVAVIIDPGHGGRDPGAQATHQIDGKAQKLQEKDITLQVAKEVNALSIATWPDKKIILTRNDDSYPTLEERVKIANSVELKPQETVLFLSIHVNASLNTQAQGIEVWYIPQDFDREVLRPSDAHQNALPILNDFQNYEYKVESRELSKKILNSLEKELGRDYSDRGLKENPWFVVRMAKMPAVLVEMGFLTNPDEAKRLSDPAYLKKLAKAIYTGLLEFIVEFEGTGGTH